MKIKLKKKINYSPYKIFQRNYTHEKLSSFNYSQIPKYKNAVIDISKNLKSVAISNKLFSSYMENYTNLTQDHCFKSPDIDNYPIRKNLRYLSASSVNNTKNFYKLNKRKILNKPLSSNNKFNLKLNNDIFVNKYIKNRNKKNDLLIELSEGEFYKKNNIKISGNNFIKIDIDNSPRIKKDHFEFLKNYINNINEDNEIFEKTKLSMSNMLPKVNVKYDLSIYSLCLKFRALNSDKKIKQKIYLKFKYLPIFYLLNYQLFKLFLSEIIYYDDKSKSFSLIRNNFDDVVNKYCKYINIHLNNKGNNINDITFLRNEFSFLLLFKWFIYNKDFNDKNDKQPKIFEMKIELPKIKFNIKEYEIKIKNNLKKNLMIQLMKKKFLKWEQIILFDLYFIKNFRYITNSILINNEKYFKQKINLSSIHNSKNQTDLLKLNKNKNYEFFISDVNENCSHFYIFNPYVIILSRFKNKYYQEINLTFRESKLLYKFAKIWGYTNTLLKSINYNSEKYNKFSFDFDLLENISSNYLKTSTENKNSNKKEQMKFKFNKININIIECCLKTIFIKDSEISEKLIKIPNKFLRLIFINKENKFLLYQNKINDYLKEIREEKKAEMKKDKFFKITYEKEFENSEISLNEKNNKRPEKINSNNIKEEESKQKNDNKLKLSPDKTPTKIINFSERISKKTNTNLFLTKNNKKEYINNENEKINHFLSQYTNLKNTNNNKNLYLIKNKRELEKNRTARDNIIINNNENNNFNQIKLAILNIRNRKNNSITKK